MTDIISYDWEIKLVNKLGLSWAKLRPASLFSFSLLELGLGLSLAITKLFNEMNIVREAKNIS